MASVRTFQRSFGGGEVTPEFFGRIDDAKFQSGAAKMRNFIALPHGPAANRPGFAFVREVKDSTKRTRLIPFAYSTTQTMVIELGAGYFRFHTGGATLMSGPSPYELANTYAEADLFDIHYVQSADVLTLVHPNYPPKELRRVSSLSWTLTTVSFIPNLTTPSGVTVTATRAAAPTGLQDYFYKLTTVGSDGLEESLASAAAQTNITNNLLQTGAFNTVAWTATTGATRYNIYKLSNGLYGYIGQTTGLSFTDDNITADISKTPPEQYNPFPAPGGIASVAVTAGGSGYGTALVSGGAITSVSITAAGTGYTAPTLTVSDPTGSGATFTVTVGGGGAITAVNVTASGTNYSNPIFLLTDSPAGGSGARLTPTITARVFGTPTLTVTDAGGGTGAVLTPQVVSGVITGIVVANAGSGYVTPIVTVGTAAGGAGATFGTPVVTAVGDYPAAVSYFEQRRCFAGTTNKPQNLWMTRSGTESNMSYSLPTRDDDSINVRVAAREANTIRHIVPLSNLVLLTSAAEWRVTSVNTDAITPTSISVKPQSYIGSSNVQPVIINNNLIYIAARGGHVRELAYAWQASGYITGDLSLRAPHLFDGLTISDLAYAKSPQPICWFVSSAGKLLGLTYVPEQEVGAWHQHDTDGSFESITVVAEGNEDALYAIVQRTLNGVSKRYVERMASRLFSTQADAFFVDAGLTYSGAPATTISGLSHLEGKTVSILADGAVHPQRVVTSGSITLDQAASKVQVGLPIQSDLQTLPFVAQVDGSFGQGRYKNVNKAWLRVYRSSGIFVGPSATALVEAKQRTTEIYGTPPALKSEEIQVMLTPSWADSGQVFIRQSDPLPLTIVSLSLEVALGG